MSNKPHDSTCLCPECFDPFSEFEAWAVSRGYDIDNLEQLIAATEAYGIEEDLKFCPT